MKKKIISIVCALALIGTMTAALTACDVKGGGGNAEKVKVDANDVYALSALTGAEYLDQTESGATGAAETTRPGVITDADVKFKIKYEKGKEKGFITVEAVEGGYKLTYNNGYFEVI